MNTSAQSNNKAVEFLGQPVKEMPKPPNMDVSTPPLKAPQKVKKMKMSRKGRKSVKGFAKRGMISPKAMAKMVG